MAHEPPRIIVSQATFDSGESVGALGSQDSVVHGTDFDNTLTPRSTFALGHDAPQSWLQGITSWAAELVWSLLSIVILMGILMVLSAFNDKPLPHFPLGLTLNTIVAVLATFSRSVTVFLISQGISQLKWNQYVGRDRPLSNLHVFDEASRGPWGSLQMVFQTRGNLLAFLASFLIITSLASSTLTQSAITYTPRLVAEETLEARAQYAASYPRGDIVDRGFLDRLEAAAYGAIFSNINGKLPSLEPQCQSADCEWGEINTLSVCFEMRNVTDKLAVNVTAEENSKDTSRSRVNTASLMDGKLSIQEAEGSSPYNSATILNITVLEPDMLGFGDSKVTPRFPYPRKSVAFKGEVELLNTTLLHLFFLYNTPGSSFYEPGGRYHAIEVLMHFCVQTLAVSVSQGESNTKAVNSHTQISHINEGTFSISGVGETNFFELSSEDGTSKFDVRDYLDLGRDLQKAFCGFFSVGEQDNSVLQMGTIAREIALKTTQGIDHLTPTGKADEMTWKNVQGVCDTIAVGMTNYMREAGREINGTALTSVTFVEVRWEWLTLVAAQVGLSIIFLFAVVIGTKKLGVDVVKSSNMAELFAMQSSSHCSGCHNCTVAGLKTCQDFVYDGINTGIGKNIAARLRRRSDGWKLELKRREAEI